SGAIIAIALSPIAGSDAKQMAIIIESDGEDTVYPECKPLNNPLKADPQLIRKKIAEAGIVGLGGALFPTAVKLNPAPGIQTLIINGVECEPDINCDNQLLQDAPDSIIRGAQIMLHALKATEIIIAIECDMTAAISAMETAAETANDMRIKVVAVPDIYPAGGEKQLIECITGLQVPGSGIPADLGIVCQNAGTAAAVDQLINTGEPLISRMLTITGDSVASPLNLNVRIGTPISDLIAFSNADSPDNIVIGGPMMGVIADSAESAITKASNCIILNNTGNQSSDYKPPPTELPCIRCGDCVPVCPAGLNPQLLLESIKIHDTEATEQLGAIDCIDCGCCDYVCPSGIGLTAQFKLARQSIWEHHLLEMRAARAQQRFIEHEIRLKDQNEKERQELNAQTAAFHDVSDNSKAALDKLLNRIKTGDDQ
ncbi:MAG: electron transport complex subunit RsxC, partial [Gammaproteobacteria bacterium]|nr:electron transport complex subunit RsxC [Gammaproteobacteria bacterium]